MYYKKSYLLADGTITDSKPYLFSKRDDLICMAEDVAKKLNWTKKIKPNTSEFINLWLHDKDVRRYRELMRLIWGFMGDLNKTVVREFIGCWRCGKYDVPLLLVAEIPAYRKDKTIHYDHIYCEKCYQEHADVWSKEINPDYYYDFYTKPFEGNLL